MFALDLKSGYPHVEIFSEHRKFLPFAWDFDDGEIRYFSFCVLPFGLSSAPHLFTKLLKPVSKFWRSQGIPFVIFLDDGLGSAVNELLAKIYSLQVNADLARLSFVVNEEKSQWTPVRIIIWLGIVLNTINGTISVTDKRISKLKISLDSICESVSGVVKVKELARAVGQIISLSPVVGNLSRIMTQSMYTVIKERFPGIHL